MQQDRCRRLCVQRAEKKEKKRIEPQAFKQPFKTRKNTYSPELDAWFFSEWDVNIFISESLRLISMPTLIAWMQDFQQKNHDEIQKMTFLNPSEQ